MSLPHLRLTGNAYEQGLQHGCTLKEQIAQNLTLYFDRFEQEGELSRDEVRCRAKRDTAVIQACNSDCFAALVGVAEGCDLPLEALVALNVRYEILYHQFAHSSGSDCSSFAVLPDTTADGHLLMGQNRDWIPQVQWAVLHVTEPDGLQLLRFTEAGIVGGKIGLNSEGL